jgi:hypothetical protein
MFQEITNPASHPSTRGLLGLPRDPSACNPRTELASTSDVLEVAQVWGDVILELRHFSASREPITLVPCVGGKGRRLGRPRPAFFAPSEILPDGDLPLFTWADGLVVCAFPEGWNGSVQRPDGNLTLKEALEKANASLDEDGLYHMALPPDTRVVLDLGVMQFVARVVPRGHRAFTRVAERLDYPFLAVLSSTLLVGLLSGVLVASQQPPPEDQVIELPSRIIQMILQDQKAEPERVIERKGIDDDSRRAKTDDVRTSKRDDRDRSKGRPDDVRRQQIDKEIAERAGVLGAMRDGSELDSVFASSSLSAGISAGVGGLIGVRGVDLDGRGLGSRGLGIGGGHVGDIGGMTTRGNRSGDPSYGAAAGNLWKKQPSEINLGDVKEFYGVQIDRAQVDAVVRRNLGLIRHCYQMELNRSPSLSGKIVERFVIGRDGSVSAATTKSSSLGNARVEQCINQRFLRFQFPAPKGNGVVFVTYPFIFSPG